MNDLQTKLFLDWEPNSSVEATADEIRDAETYSRGYFDSSGALVRLELYDGGNLDQVYYYGSDIESITSDHTRDYPELAFAVVHKEGASAGFHWEFTTRYAADGSRRLLMFHLFDPRNLEIMNLDYSIAGDLRAITKFWYESADEIGLMFEYRKDGTNVDVANLEEGESVPLEAVLRALPEPDFYADGFALPPQLVGTSIPSVGDHFRPE
ncbi:hypothetical protein BJ973_007979 [Actinoplanes tereljensis]|uniref:Uncharacterized protein n=1 Tax=Paractinoplanes tereljensis TaxID=571912 RepID=A0A919TXS5_9ACTN|nr:hypothetical protein [Actinoplanes tereljensis]GIF24500.1 hypothetical protein Ate02nite_72300 [Actinoplanes tereljensis]